MPEVRKSQPDGDEVWSVFFDKGEAAPNPPRLFGAVLDLVRRRFGTDVIVELVRYPLKGHVLSHGYDEVTTALEGLSEITTRLNWGQPSNDATDASVVYAPSEQLDIITAAQTPAISPQELFDCITASAGAS